MILMKGNSNYKTNEVTSKHTQAQNFLAKKLIRYKIKWQ